MLSSLIAVNTVIDTVNFCMALADAMNTNTTPKPTIVRVRSLSINSVQSAGSVSSKMGSDSGYGSGDDEGQDQGKSKTSSIIVCSSSNHLVDFHRDMRPPDMPHETCENDDQIFISHEHFLYAMIAVLVIYVIDCKILVLPLVALRAYIVRHTTLKPPIEAESILNLPAFRIDWTLTPKVQYEQVTKVFYVEKPIHNYYHKVERKPVMCHAATQTVSEFKPKYADQANSNTTATNYITSEVQTDAIVSVKPKHIDQATSIDVVFIKTVGTQTSSSAKSVITASGEQEAEMLRSAAIRNRVRRVPVHPSKRNMKPIRDSAVIELGRSNNTVFTIKDIKCRDLLHPDPDPPRPVLPPPHPHSAAAYEGFDPFIFTQKILFHHGEPILNPFMWVKTCTPHVYASATYQGAWLVIAEQAAYFFEWKVDYNVWYCQEHGFGFYENKPGHGDPFTLVYGDLSPANEKMRGPNRTGIMPEGPYWWEATEDARQFIWEEQEKIRLVNLAAAQAAEAAKLAAKLVAEQEKAQHEAKREAGRVAEKAKTRMRHEQDEAKLKMNKKLMTEEEKKKYVAEQILRMQEGKRRRNEQRAKEARSNGR